MTDTVAKTDFLKTVRLTQPSDGYRFSVDALLLYGFVNMKEVSVIADFGAGCGVIGLLLSVKYPKAQVYLIELQEELAHFSLRNIALNKLQDKARLIHADICSIFDKHPELKCEGFDLIVSNPPFRRLNTGKVSNLAGRAIARHEMHMPLPCLAKASAYLLKQKGRLCIIHLPERLAEIFTHLKNHSLEPKRLRFVHSFANQNAKMVLVEAVKRAKAGLKVEHPLVIYNPDGSYTDEMTTLYDGV